jgi:hypothetical protein
VQQILTYIEADAGMADDRTTAAWAFDLDLWGRCGQGLDEDSALVALSIDSGRQVLPVVVERITGDEQVFQRDLQPATDAERTATLAILAAARQETLTLVTSSPPEVLDFDDPARTLPAWAHWRTLRQMAWHLADTESRYYLPSVDVPTRPAEPDLITELSASARHVRAVVSAMPADLIHRARGEIWTSTKVLRRLAWHERSELVTMRRLARQASAILHADHG